MRKWYEWMAQHQGSNSAPVDNFVVGNIHDQTQCLRAWLDTGKWEIENQGPAFNADHYVSTLSPDYKKLGLDFDTVRNWVDDPEYARLIKESGQSVYISLPYPVRKKFIQQAQDSFPVNWDTAQIAVMLQRPGDMFPLHFDRKKSWEFDLDSAQEKKIQRWLVMLYDQQPGQCLFMNNRNVSWRSGDIIGWDQTNLGHGSANFGYYPRFSVRITAELN
jgi:hypothetical protein